MTELADVRERIAAWNAEGRTISWVGQQLGVTPAAVRSMSKGMGLSWRKKAADVCSNGHPLIVPEVDFYWIVRKERGPHATYKRCRTCARAAAKRQAARGRVNVADREMPHGIVDRILELGVLRESAPHWRKPHYDAEIQRLQREWK